MVVPYTKLLNEDGFGDFSFTNHSEKTRHVDTIDL